MDSDKCTERIYTSIYSVILGRYQWQLADTLCPSPEDIETMMGRVSAVPGPLLGWAQCRFVMESVVQCRECHGQWGC